MRRLIHTSIFLTMILTAALPVLAGDTHGGGPGGGRLPRFSQSDSPGFSAEASFSRTAATNGTRMGALTLPGEDYETSGAAPAGRATRPAATFLFPRLRYSHFLIYLMLLGDFVYF